MCDHRYISYLSFHRLCNINEFEGTSSGLGKETAKSLIESGDFYVVCAVRDVEKMKKIATEEKFELAGLAECACGCVAINIEEHKFPTFFNCSFCNRRILQPYHQ